MYTLFWHVNSVNLIITNMGWTLVIALVHWNWAKFLIFATYLQSHLGFILNYVVIDWFTSFQVCTSALRMLQYCPWHNQGVQL